MEEKPGTLTWVLALSPIPILGENAASRITNYEIECQFREDPHLTRENLRRYEKSAAKKILAIRAVGYIWIPLAVSLGYQILKDFFN